MASSLVLWNYDELSKTSTPLPLGERLLIKQDQIGDLIAETFDTGISSFSTNIPVCRCGAMSGTFHIGSICNVCNTEVKDVFTHELRYKSHIHIPERLPPVLNPTTYHVLCGVFTKTLMNKILDPTKQLAAKYQGRIPQGFQAFYDTFRETINQLLAIKGSANQETANELNLFLDTNAEAHWVRNLPIMDSSLHSLSEESGRKLYGDSIPSIMKCIWTISEIEYAVTTSKIYDDLYIPANMWVAYVSYMEYVDSVLKDQLFGKEGVYRKHVLGARCHFSFRAVIAPISGPHKADHIRLPWRVGVAIYEFEIYNLLMNRYGYNLTEAAEIYRQATVSSSPLISEIFSILVDESPFEALPCILGRNP